MFGYMSTSYCHLHESFLLEKPYDPPADPHKIIKSVELLHEDEVELMSKKILGTLPNTYAFTKALAEALVNEASEKYNLPAMILRPSIVIPTFTDPVAGWTGLSLNFLKTSPNVIIVINRQSQRTCWNDDWRWQRRYSYNLL